MNASPSPEHPQGAQPTGPTFSERLDRDVEDLISIYNVFMRWLRKSGQKLRAQK